VRADAILDAEPPTGRLVQLASFEHEVACAVARAVASEILLGLLRSASRLGDLWLSVSVGLLLLAAGDLAHAAVYVAFSLLAVALQKILKRTCGRLRPCERPGGPPQRVPIPDKGSFPSGHTLHAVMAAVVVAALLPSLTAVFLVVAVLVAVSRVVLGVHYPSDVVAGAGLGVSLGILQLALLTP
jgi:undecaprenyl-diphosphatase